MQLTQFVDILVETKTDERCLYRGTCLQRLFECSKALREAVDLTIRPCTECQSFCILPETRENIIWREDPTSKAMSTALAKEHGTFDCL